MVDVYHAASGGRRLPINAPQVMYAARKRILDLTGTTKPEKRYFTQTLPNPSNIHLVELVRFGRIYLSKQAISTEFYLNGAVEFSPNL